MMMIIEAVFRMIRLFTLASSWLVCSVWCRCCLLLVACCLGLVGGRCGAAARAAAAEFGAPFQRGRTVSLMENQSILRLKIPCSLSK